jgi:hypothetical protein
MSRTMARQIIFDAVSQCFVRRLFHDLFVIKRQNQMTSRVCALWLVFKEKIVTLTRIVRGIVRRERNADLKSEVLRKLNQHAQLRQIAVIFQIFDQTDPTTNEYYRRYQSSWPVTRLDVCLFCGEGFSHAVDCVRLDKFGAHPWCEEEPFGGTRVGILEKNHYRPAVILVPIWFPGSFSNAILDLAWGLVAHELSNNASLLSQSRLEREAGIEAARLVRSVEELVAAGRRPTQ